MSSIFNDFIAHLWKLKVEIINLCGRLEICVFCVNLGASAPIALNILD